MKHRQKGRRETATAKAYLVVGEVHGLESIATAAENSVVVSFIVPAILRAFAVAFDGCRPWQNRRPWSVLGPRQVHSQMFLRPERKG